MTKTEPDPNPIVGVSFDDTRILLALADGRVLATPIRRYIRVAKATPAQRQEWTLTPDGRGLNWPALWPPADHGMVSAWELEQNALYDHALALLRQAGWNLAALPRDARELAALWRLEADINNGGFLQFFCNWGEQTCQLALDALDRIGARAARRCLGDMAGVIARYGETSEPAALQDLPGRLTEADSERLYELDQEFWSYPDRLDVLVVREYAARMPQAMPGAYSPAA